MEETLLTALSGDDFRATASAARRSLNVAGADLALADLQVALSRSQRFLPIVRDVILEIRR